MHYDLVNMRSEGEIMVSSQVIYADSLMTLIILGLYLAQQIIDNNGELNYFQVGILMVSRAYLKLPNLVCMASHQL